MKVGQNSVPASQLINFLKSGLNITESSEQAYGAPKGTSDENKLCNRIKCHKLFRVHEIISFARNHFVRTK